MLNRPARQKKYHYQSGGFIKTVPAHTQKISGAKPADIKTHIKNPPIIKPMLPPMNHASVVRRPSSIVHRPSSKAVVTAHETHVRRSSVVGRPSSVVQTHVTAHEPRVGVVAVVRRPPVKPVVGRRSSVVGRRSSVVGRRSSVVHARRRANERQFRTPESKKDHAPVGERWADHIYPHQLGSGPAARGREIRAQLAIAVRYFETMVGQRRLAFDSEALIALFGDPKLARGLVAAFARYYRYRRLEFADVVPAAVADDLREKRLGTSAALRANLFRFLNTAPRAGFAAEADRADLLAAFGADLSLDPEQMADLLWLDSEENWVLTRLAVPEPADLVALYDFLALEMLVRYASKLDLIFRAPTPEAVRRDVRLLLGHYDLACDLPPEETPGAWRLTIHGRADARGSWARHGKRLVRLLVRLLAAHPACLESGEAQIELSQSAPVLRLDSALLAHLGADPRGAPGAGADLPPVLTPAACADLRAAGLPAGWRLTVDPEPLVDSHGVLAPLALCARRGALWARRVYLLDVNSPAALTRVERMLPHLRGRADFLLLAAPEVCASDRPCRPRTSPASRRAARSRRRRRLPGRALDPPRPRRRARRELPPPSACS